MNRYGVFKIQSLTRTKRHGVIVCGYPSDGYITVGQTVDVVDPVEKRTKFKCIVDYIDFNYSGVQRGYCDTIIRLWLKNSFSECIDKDDYIVYRYEEEIDSCPSTSYIEIGNSQSQNKIGGANDTSSPMDELKSLIGLSQIKDDVGNLINLVKMQKMREERGLKTVPVSLHLVFTGNPGTGKTTVARILAEIYKEIGILTTGQLIEVDRSGLVAGYVGQTAIKTKEKINEAKGGILFIDEAYTLVKDGTDFGQEAIDTLLKEMEDNRDQFVVIVAGYDEPMQKFICSNPGLKSRFNKFFHFEDYSADEMIEIFNRMVSSNDYRITSSALCKTNKYIKTLVENKDDNFANARCIRNYFEQIITNQASRVMNLPNITRDDVITITEDDV